MENMCGRFVGFRRVEELKQYFPIDQARCEATANYNVAPSQEILALARLQGANVLDHYHWGLVPFWAKDTVIGSKMINARVETVAEKPAFREAFKKRRCLILADGFYEWKAQKGKKQPVYITLPDQAPFAFAGLWESWQNKESPLPEPYRSCTIITRAAMGPIEQIHHRMPVILSPPAYAQWLDTELHDPEVLLALMQTQCLTDIVFHPVSRQVNTVSHNDPSNVKPVQMEFDF
ncbi:MAG: SOS response-associated peptidase [Desulfobacteraceae bacterium]|nr:SOS response-associated peptidase [Desulfobacteraceae bacterium]